MITIDLYGTSIKINDNGNIMYCTGDMVANGFRYSGTKISFYNWINDVDISEWVVSGSPVATITDFITALAAIIPQTSGGGSNVLIAATIITDAQFKSLNTVPVNVIPAPATGKLNIAIGISFIQNFIAPYDSLDAANEDYLNFRYGQFEPNDADIATIPNTIVNPNLNQVLTATGQKISVMPILNLINDTDFNIISRTLTWQVSFFQEGLYIGGTIAFTGGNSANTLKVICSYISIDL